MYIYYTYIYIYIYVYICMYLCIYNTKIEGLKVFPMRFGGGLFHGNLSSCEF